MDASDLRDGPNFLSRVDIDLILNGMTARDIFAGMPTAESGELEGNEIAGRTFEKAAERQGYGAAALDRIRPSDAVYLARELGEVFTQDSPKDGDSGDSPDSSDTGGSTPS